MKKQPKKHRQHYSPEFKSQAIELANEIGTKQAAEKLGIDNIQTLAIWVRHAKKLNEDAEYREMEELRTEIKKLRKQAEEDKKVIAILKDAAVFFVRTTKSEVSRTCPA